MNRLKRFSTETQYDLSKDDFEYATVSWVEDVDDVRYMTLRDKYTREYLTFEALEDGTFTLSIPANVNSTYMTSVSYSTDNGKTWTTTNVDSTAQTITTSTINAGNKVLWKGVGKQMAKSSSSNNYSYFSSTGNFNASGNIMSLLYGDEFANQVVFPSGSTYNFAELFLNANKLISASNMVLPATTLASSCYRDIFYGCKSLTTAPSILPATTLVGNCYRSMFSGCTSLTTAPELPATTLASGCYQYMFQGCTSLTTAPELPATTLTTECYYQMFYGCTSLTTAPELPVTTLTDHCYSSMFNGCTSLTTAPELPATTLTSGCYSSMFSGCTSLTTAPVLPATTLVGSCYHGMFNGCTSLTTAPELPATTLATYCYYQMFWNCTSLTTAPELPATTLANRCYDSMFWFCSKINYIKAMFTTTPSATYTNNWVNGVASTGTFVKNSAATWDVTGTNGIPTGWTVETANE